MGHADWCATNWYVHLGEEEEDVRKRIARFREDHPLRYIASVQCHGGT
jgi:hypothetical protein